MKVKQILLCLSYGQLNFNLFETNKSMVLIRKTNIYYRLLIRKKFEITVIFTNLCTVYFIVLTNNVDSLSDFFCLTLIGFFIFTYNIFSVMFIMKYSYFLRLCYQNVRLSSVQLPGTRRMAGMFI